jgi:quinol monooxygenase YgiN
MIILKITMNVIFEKHKELMQTILSMMEPMEKVPGCLSFDLYCDIEDKNILTLFEEWQTRKDLDLHLQSEIFGVLLGTKSLLSESHGIRIYTIRKSEGVEALHFAREINTA